MLARHAEHLAPGWYVCCGHGVWRRAGTHLPTPVAVSKLRSGSGAERFRRWWSIGRREVSRLESGLFRLVAGGDPDGYEIAIDTSDDGCLLLDPRSGRVARQLPRVSDLSGQLRFRDQWAEHIPSPRFSVADNGGWIIEEYIEGRPAAELPTTNQVDVIRQMFDAYARLVAATGRVPEADPYEGSIELLQSHALPLHLSAILDRAQQSRSLLRAPLVPTTADPSIENLIVKPDGTPTLVDVHPLRHLPFFYLPIMFAASSRRAKGLRDAYFGGELDDSLAGLFEAADLEPPSGLAGRQMLLALSLVTYGVYRTRREGQLDPGRLASFFELLLTRGDLLHAEEWR